jgi:hypothetical protein
MPDHRPHASAAFAVHGAARLAPVEVDAYEAEIHGAGGGLVGDRASRRAFHLILEEWRERLRRAAGEDPLGETPSDGLGKKKLRRLLAEGEPEAAGVLHGAIEDFAQELAAVARRFLGLEGWRGTQRIVVGGGLRGGRVGEVAIGRAAVLLKVEGQGVEMRPICHHPDAAGLIGCAHLAPPWVFAGHDGILAADIGGTNIRAGVVEPRLGAAPDLAEARVWASERWRHADDGPTRDEAVERLGDMLRRLARRAEKEGLRLAPFLGVGCPGRVAEDGSIERGGQNLPGGGTGRTGGSTCRGAYARSSPPSAGTRPWSRCTTTRWCRG